MIECVRCASSGAWNDEGEQRLGAVELRNWWPCVVSMGTILPPCVRVDMMKKGALLGSSPSFKKGGWEDTEAEAGGAR
jgi:hypothetical protein